VGLISKWKPSENENQGFHQQVFIQDVLEISGYTCAW